MKKLISMLLCVMLFISVLSGSAFAKVNLSPAYQSMNALYNAYGNLAAAQAYTVAVNSVRALVGNNANLADYGLANPAQFMNGATSYERLFQQVGPSVYTAYAVAGTRVAVNVQNEAQRVANRTIAAINSKIPFLFR